MSLGFVMYETIHVDIAFSLGFVADKSTYVSDSLLYTVYETLFSFGFLFTSRRHILFLFFNFDF
jgi:hypothetical protein